MVNIQIKRRKVIISSVNENKREQRNVLVCHRKCFGYILDVEKISRISF